MTQFWSCKIGIIGSFPATATRPDGLPDGADFPMRQAVKEAFVRLTGRNADFCFSGWNATLTPSEMTCAQQAARDMEQWERRFGRR